MSLVQSKTGITGNSTTCTATLDAPAAAGNILVAVMNANRSSTNIVGPAGWTEIVREHQDPGENMVIAVLTAAGGETAVTFTASAGNSRMIITVLELTSVSSPPIQGDQVHSAGVNGNSITEPDASPGTAGDRIVTVGTSTGLANPEPWGSWDNGFTTISALDSGVNSNNIGQSVGIGPSGGSTQTWSTVVAYSGRMLLFPATAPPPPPSGFTGWGIPA
jgi:hypothetical protein